MGPWTALESPICQLSSPKGRSRDKRAVNWRDCSGEGGAVQAGARGTEKRRAWQPGQAAEGRPRTSAARQGASGRWRVGLGGPQGAGGESSRGGRWRGAEARQNEGHCPLTVSGARAGDECSPSMTPKQPAVPAGASSRHTSHRLAGCHDSPL